VLLSVVLGVLTLLSLVLTMWQWATARRFPLHRLEPHPGFAPPITLLKPLKGRDHATEMCLRSWFAQQYGGPLQILFGVATAEDPVCEVVRKLIQQFPSVDAELLICDAGKGANAKVSKLSEMEKRAKYEFICVSDADVRVTTDFLANNVRLFEGESSTEPDKDGMNKRSPIGLVNCFYQLANPTTLAMRWEAVAINADFWSQVLQSRDLKPLDFALGAVMLLRADYLREIGGFISLVDCLADDYQLGHRLAAKGYRIELANQVVECHEEPMNWKAVWKHQLRWARTIRVSQPLPYFFSILSNATLWPLFWLVVRPGLVSTIAASVCIALRTLSASELQSRLTLKMDYLIYGWLVPVKDLLQVGIWAAAFLGRKVEWAGQKMVLKPDGTLAR
jgi:ceramide glucosyltransferase